MSHDDVYHTMLGVMELRNDSYDPQRDLLAPCISHRAQLAASTVRPAKRFKKPAKRTHVARALPAGGATRNTLQDR